MPENAPPPSVQIGWETYGLSDEQLAQAVESGARAYWWTMTVGAHLRTAPAATMAGMRLRTSDGVAAVPPGRTPREVYSDLLEFVATHLAEDPDLDLGRGLSVLHWDLRPNEPLA